MSVRIEPVVRRALTAMAVLLAIVAFYYVMTLVYAHEQKSWPQQGHCRPVAVSPTWSDCVPL